MDITSDYNSPDHEKRLEEILAEYLDAIDAGETPDRQAWLTQHPEFADDLRRFFAAQDQFAPLRPRHDSNPRKIRYVGDYELLEELGRGGMGVVYKARQVSLNRTVAVKLILDSHLVSATDVQRFHIEAEAAANLQHPGIVAVYEVGENAGQHYFSMTYIEGRTLAALIREGPLPAAQAARYVHQIANAIHYAHQQGTLHRDIKPSNILIDLEDQPHITDFGLAKRVSADSDLTATGAVVGTPGYMSPEQALSQQEDIGPAIDVYSLGATLYAAIAGRPPFQAANVVDTLQQVILAPPVSPRALNPAIPRDLETICLKCLEKDRGKRYATAAELGDDLQCWLNGEPIRARPVGVPGRLWRWCKRQPLVAGLTGALILCLIVGTLASTHFAIRERKRAMESVENAVRAEASSQDAMRSASVARAAAEREASHRKEAERRSRIADALRLAAHANHLRHAYPQRSALLAIASLKATMDSGEPPLLAAEQTLRDSLRVVGGKALPASGGVSLMSQQGRWLVTRNDHTLRLWDLTAKDPAVTGVVLQGRDERPSMIETSEDGRWLVVATDRTVRLWDLAASAPADTVVVLGRHDRPITNMELNGDGSWLAVAHSEEKLIRLWELTTKGPTRRTVELRRHEKAVVCFSPNGHWLVTEGVDENAARLWDLTGPTPASVAIGLRGHKEGICLASFSRDGRWLAAAGYRDNAVQLWGLGTKDPAASAIALRGHERPVQCAAFSPNGRWLITGSEDATARLWDMGAMAPAATAVVLPHNKGPVHHLVVSPNSHWLITRSFSNAWLWRLNSKAPAITGRDLRGGDNVCAISPDSRWLVTGDKEVRLWDLNADDSHNAPTVLYSCEAGVRLVCYSRDTRWLVTADADDTARLWDLNAKPPTASQVPFRGHEKLRDAMFTSDGRWLVTSDASTTRLWRLPHLPRAAIPTELSGDGKPIRRAVISPDSHWLATLSNNATVRLRDLTSDDPAASEAVLAGQEQQIDRIVFSPDGQYLMTGGADLKLRLWHLTGRNCIRGGVALCRNETPIKHLAVSPDSRWLVAVEQNEVMRLWNLGATPAPTADGVLRVHDTGIQAVVFAPNSHWLVAGKGDGTIRVWDLAATVPADNVRQLPGHKGGILALAISPDGRWLIARGGCAKKGTTTNAVTMWDLTSHNSTNSAIALRHEGGVLSHAISPDSRWLVTGSGDKTAWMWDLTAQDPASAPIALDHSAPVAQLDFSPDSRWLVSICLGRDNSTSGMSGRVWDLTGKRPTASPVVLGQQEGLVSLGSLRFSPNSRWLLTATIAGQGLGPRMWDLTTNAGAKVPIKLPGDLPAFIPPVRSIFDPLQVRDSCNRLIVTEDRQGIMVWDITAEQPPATGIMVCGKGEAGRYRSVSPDGRWLVTDDDQGKVYLWRLRTRELMDVARTTVGRDLTNEERRQYLLEPER